ncbi:M949_RS01915 family surface polysaccharide biosynthesis protein [Enterobacter soli]|uniref:M949_RS01915 family surface polysaccharide biosynthesis protein n=1 Tax=Enterobacter soli TaxID=885040 RepID=UPI0034CFCA20
MNWKLVTAFTFLLSQSVFASYETFQKVWNDSSGKHTLIIDKKINSKDDGMTLLVRQVTGNRNDWILKDFVRNCGEDIKLEIVPSSVEVNKIFSDGVGTVLFAYKIGCIGGIDPVTVKYFAFKNGIKHSLRGEEHIIVGSEGFGGEKPPEPDFNLQNDKSLLKYMKEKWDLISTTKVN